jgi:dCTP deaminase
LVPVTIDLEGAGKGSLVGFRARRHTRYIDLERVRHYEADEFWDPIRRTEGRSLILDPAEFYILVTREEVRIPPDLAAEMVAYHTRSGEYRVHYAGFFDPGFGWDTSNGGSRAVLEVRSHEVPFMLEHGQPVGWLRYEWICGGRPEKLYGAGIGSNYQGQGLALAKQFKPFGAA